MLRRDGKYLVRENVYGDGGPEKTKKIKANIRQDRAKWRRRRPHLRNGK